MTKIETNLEESKKIKELGYDFSFAAKEFYDLLSRELLYKVTEDYYFSKREGKILRFDYVVPAVPLPALGACLPAKLPDGSIWKKFLGTDGEDTVLRCFGDNHKSVETFSTFGAFLWCHQNYPTETRAKFERVKKDIGEKI